MQEKKSTKAGLARVFPAFKYALSGLSLGYKEEPAFRQEVWLYGLLWASLWWLGLPLWASAVFLASILLVLLVELLNSGLEAVVDLVVEGKYHLLAKKAKDTAAGAVLLANILALGTYAVMLFYHLNGGL